MNYRVLIDLGALVRNSFCELLSNLKALRNRRYPFSTDQQFVSLSRCHAQAMEHFRRGDGFPEYKVADHSRLLNWDELINFYDFNPCRDFAILGDSHFK